MANKPEKWKDTKKEKKQVEKMTNNIVSEFGYGEKAKPKPQMANTPKLNPKKVQDMLTGKTRVSPIDTTARKKQLSDFEKGQALQEAIRKKTGVYPNTAN